MKVRHPLMLKAAAFSGSWLVRWWMSTLRYRYRPSGSNVDPLDPRLRGRYIYAMWHEMLLLPAHVYARSDTCVLISQHADGQLFAELCRHLRIPVVRGSTTRGGVHALRKLLRAGTTHVALTPDGPRGPRRRVQPGVIYLASRTGLPIVPVGFAYRRPWRARSWDRFAVPKPWSLGTCVTADPIAVPPDAGRESLEEYRRRVEAALLWATREAEGLAEAG